MLSLSSKLNRYNAYFYTHFYQQTFDDVDIATFLNHKYKEYYVQIHLKKGEKKPSPDR